MKDIKPSIEELAVELVEFDDHDQQIRSTITPLGAYLHDAPATETMADQPVTTAPASDEAVDTNPELGEAATEHPDTVRED